MCLVQTTTILKLITRLRGRQDSMKRSESGKAKFKLHLVFNKAADFHSGRALDPEIDKREVRRVVK